MFNANFKPNIPNGSREEVNFVVLAILSNSGDYRPNPILHF